MPQCLVPGDSLDVLQGSLGIPKETEPSSPNLATAVTSSVMSFSDFPSSVYLLFLLILGVSSPITHSHPVFREVQSKATNLKEGSSESNITLLSSGRTKSISNSPVAYFKAAHLINFGKLKKKNPRGFKIQQCRRKAFCHVFGKVGLSSTKPSALCLCAFVIHSCPGAQSLSTAEGLPASPESLLFAGFMQKCRESSVSHLPRLGNPTRAL